MKPQLALSIKQPWASLIAAGYKDIENRSWPATYKGMPFRGRIFIHAGKAVDHEGAVWIWENRERLGLGWYTDFWTGICNTWKQSAIIGEVDIVDCIDGSDIGVPATKSPWFSGHYGFVLANPKLYVKPIPCKGALRFFEPNHFPDQQSLEAFCKKVGQL